MSWLEKLMPSRIRTEGTGKRKMPEGLWDKCTNCGAVLYRSDLERNLQVCPKCSHHMRIGARARLHAFLDESPLEEIGQEIEPKDFLKFRDSKKYKDRLAAAQKTPRKVKRSGHERQSEEASRRRVAFEFSLSVDPWVRWWVSDFSRRHGGPGNAVPLVCFHKRWSTHAESTDSLFQSLLTSACWTACAACTSLSSRS